MSYSLFHLKLPICFFYSSLALLWVMGIQQTYCFSDIVATMLVMPWFGSVQLRGPFCWTMTCTTGWFSLPAEPVWVFWGNLWTSSNHFFSSRISKRQSSQCPCTWASQTIKYICVTQMHHSESDMPLTGPLSRSPSQPSSHTHSGVFNV